MWVMIRVSTPGIGISFLHPGGVPQVIYIECVVAPLQGAKMFYTLPGVETLIITHIYFETACVHNYSKRCL